MTFVVVGGGGGGGGRDGGLRLGAPVGQRARADGKHSTGGFGLATRQQLRFFGRRVGGSRRRGRGRLCRLDHSRQSLQV